MFGLLLTSRVTSTEKASNIHDYQLHGKESYAHMTEHLGSTNCLPRAATLLEFMILEKGLENRREWSQSLIEEGNEMVDDLSREAGIDQIIGVGVIRKYKVMSHHRAVAEECLIKVEGIMQKHSWLTTMTATVGF